MVTFCLKSRTQSGKAYAHEFGGDHAAEENANPNFRHMNKPSQINPCAVLQSCLINTVYQCYKKKWGRGGGL